jgi:glycosyltransferase involved in cell wall biosynthesis
MSAPLITVVVCTRNRCDRLRTALDSLTRLVTDDRFRYEVLVVDNGSTDATQAVVAQCAASTPVPVRCAFEPQPGIVPARNRGVMESRGRWIAFFDDDQLADPWWLVELLDAATEHDCRCVGGAVELRLPEGVERDLSPICRMLLGETVGMRRPRPYNDRITPGCGNLMVHRTVFDEIGLFDPRKNDRGEDTDLFLRMLKAGIAGWFTPTAVVQHCIPLERLGDAFLLGLSGRMGTAMAHNERNTWGAALYPFVWLARCLQALCLLTPRWLVALARGDREAELGAHCRLRMAFDSLRTGLSQMLPGRRSNHSRKPVARRPRRSLFRESLPRAKDRFALLECAVARAEDCRAGKSGLRTLLDPFRTNS